MRETGSILIAHIEKTLGLHYGSLRKESSYGNIVRGRRIFYTIMRQQYGKKITWQELADFFGQHHSTALIAVREHKRVKHPIYENEYDLVNSTFVFNENTYIRVDMVAELKKLYDDRIVLEKKIRRKENEIKNEIA